MSNEENDPSVQAALEGEETLASFVGKSEADFKAHLESMEANTAGILARAGQINAVARLTSNLASLVLMATILGIVEGIHLMWRYW